MLSSPSATAYGAFKVPLPLLPGCIGRVAIAACAAATATAVDPAPTSAKNKANTHHYASTWSTMNRFMQILSRKNEREALLTWCHIFNL